MSFLLKKHRATLSLILFCIVFYAPFSNKAFHLDSNVTVYTSRQLMHNIWDPPLGDYGYLLSFWNHTDLPKSSAFYATPHPPLIPFYLIPFIAIFGESERALNWAMFPFYCASVLFFSGLAGIFVPRQRLRAALLFALSPAVLINAQNVMLDVPLMAFILAAFYFMFLSDTGRGAFLAGIFTALACLTKSTAGTVVIAGVLYYVFSKKWRQGCFFIAPVLLLNGLWLMHNLIVWKKIQLIANGHARYLIGDIRYRFERLVSQLGGTFILPLFPIAALLSIKEYRRNTLLFLAAASLWSLLLRQHLHYSIISAFIFTISSAAGCAFIYGPVRAALKKSNDAKTLSLALHLVLQVFGGLFLGSYESRYLLPYLFIAVIFFAWIIEQVPLTRIQRPLWIAGILSTAAISLLLSIADYQYVDAERRVADDVKNSYPGKNVFYSGRLGYLYYMDRAGFKSLNVAGKSLRPGDILVRNCNSSDDSFFFTSLKNISVIRELHYPIIPFRTIGGRSGFYGCDRLPYAWVSKPADRAFRIYIVNTRDAI